MKTITALLAALSLVIAACSSSETAPVTSEPAAIGSWDVEGHRGARGLRPENTLPAFEAGLDAGVSTLELDLHLSADGVPVIWHDPELDPNKCVATDASLPAVDEEPAVRVLTVAQLATYTCNKNPDAGKYPDQVAAAGEIAGDTYGIVPLESLFDMVDRYVASDTKTAELRANAATVQFNIELKRDPRHPETIGDSFDGTKPADFEKAVAAIVVSWGYEDRVIVQSFDHRALWAFHTIVPTVRLAALTRDDIPDFAGLVASGAAIWSPRFSALSAKVVAEAHDAGLQVIPWTVDEKDDACSLRAMGTDGIITDRPDLALTTWLPCP